MIQISLPPTLYVFIQTGCEACKASERPLEEWRKRTHYRIPVIKLNVGLKDWEIAGFEPRATPTYLLVHNNEPLASHEGVLDAEEIDGWMKQALLEAGPPAEEAE
jgi:thioredoxin-like negative regulator of GroEL